MHDYDLVIGDVTDPQIPTCSEPQTILIPHVVNNVGAFGAGVARAVKEKWPKAEKDYQHWFGLWNKYDRSILGHAFSSIVSYTDDLAIVIVHMFAQDGLRGRQKAQPLDYQQLQSCMEIVPMIGRMISRPFSIHCPKFGAGLGGGDWSIIEKMIRSTWCMQDISVTVYGYRRTHGYSRNE